MTRAESGEVFIYDVAVRADRQRRGIGRQLVTVLCAAATAAGFGDVFVPVDSTDGQALDFYRALGGVPIFRQDSQTYLLEAVSKKHERIIRLLDEVRAEYRPEYGVDRDRRRYAFNGVLHTFRDREFGARAPSASRRTA
jgi:citrate lyase synthetase